MIESPATSASAAPEATQCIICGGPTRPYPGQLYDDRYGFPGQFGARTCRRCGHSHLDATFGDAELERLYTDWYPRATTRFEDLQPLAPASSFDAWLKGDRKSAFRWVPEHVAVLDIGCGFGQTVQYHLPRGCSAVGIEPDGHAAAEAQRQGLPVRHGVFHAASFEPASFDYVTMDQVIEHAVDPVSFLADVTAVLRPGGHAIISTPNRGGYAARMFGDRWINWHVPYHLNLFTRASLRHLAARSGLDVLSIRTITASSWARYQWFHWFSRPPEGVPSPFWDAKRSPITVHRRVYRTAAILDRARAFQIMSRLADGFGIGDNILTILARHDLG